MTISTSPAAPSSPPASRPRRPTWRDPRLAVGLLLVAGSVVAGASLLGEADRTTPVLAARTLLPAGTPVRASQLDSVAVRFVSSADADRYLAADADLPADAVLTRQVGPGELVPRSALGAAEDDAQVEVPLPVDVERVATGVRAGAVVDVWAAGDTAGASSDGRLLAGEVVVRAVSRGSGSGLRQVVVAVPSDDEDTVARLVAHASPGSLLIVLRDA